jgi:hypothetical protein
METDIKIVDVQQTGQPLTTQGDARLEDVLMTVTGEAPGPGVHRFHDVLVSREHGAAAAVGDRILQNGHSCSIKAVVFDDDLHHWRLSVDGAVPQQGPARLRHGSE